jgi:membrane protein
MSTPWRFATLGLAELLGRVWRRVREDRIADQSAKLSFYFLLSIFPFLFFLTSVLGLALQKDEAARAKLYGLISTVMPASAWELVDATLSEISQGAGGLQLSVALLATVWTASRGTAALIEGLNVAYEVRDYRRWWKRNLLAIGITLGLAAVTAVALPLMIYGGRAAAWVAGYFGLGGVIAIAWVVVERALALALVLGAFNLLYIVGPNVKNRRWHWLMPGTVAGVSLWLLSSYLFAVYLRFFDRYSVTYGSIGAVVVMMLWFYLSGIAILVGGEINSEIEKAEREGEAPVPKR